MRERGLALLLACASLVAFYALWLRPSSTLDPDADTARPTTAERRGNGQSAAFEWLQRSGVKTLSLRERYTRLADIDVAARGNLLVLSLPSIDSFSNDEYAPLDQWVRKGNTLLVTAALIDQPAWAVGRSSSAVAEIESLLGLEFESREVREQRLDDTPLAQRVREADEQEAEQPVDPADPVRPIIESPLQYDTPEKISWQATGPHALLAGVGKLALETDYEPEEWSLRMPYDSFALTLARTSSGEGALFEQRHGEGRIIIAAGGTLFTNRAIGSDDNAKLLANIVAASVSPNGAVLFDDLRQGLAASYDPARFYRDPRLYRTVFILLGLWLVWVLGSTRLRVPAQEVHDPSEAELVRRAGTLVARTVAPHHTARAMFDLFFASLAPVAQRAAAGSGAERGELWQWLERHAAIRPQELDQLKFWYAEAHAERKLALVPLQNLLDNLSNRLNT